MKTTSLNEAHKKLNAKMVDFAGWEMPIQYENLKDEVIAVRENAGMFDVSHMGEFWVIGPEALDFVNYAITADIKNLKNAKAIYSPILNQEGKILDDLIAYKIEENTILICVNASNIEKDFKWLLSLKKDFDCELKDVSEYMSLIALQGPKSFEILKSIPEFKKLDDLDYYGVQRLETHLCVARTGYTGEDGFEIFGTHEFIQDLWSKLIEKGVKPCGLGARDVLRLEVAYPLYGNDLSEELTPFDCALKWTVKMNKDNFMGKKALEGYSPKHQLVKLILPKGIPRPGYLVFNNNDEEIGKITSGTISVKLNSGIALALIDSKKLPENGEYYIDIRNKKYIANITKKAFVQGSHK